MKNDLTDVELILGNSNPNFSGVTSTMLQVYEYQRKIMKIAILGKHHLPDDATWVSFFDLVRLFQKKLAKGKYRVFHARRNNEVIQALVLKKIFGAQIKIVFTATAQRKHSWITRFLIKQCDGIITTCKAAEAYIEGGADLIIPHGIDSRRYRPKRSSDAKLNLEVPGKHYIGVFGRVRYQKGIDILVDAAIPLLKKHKDFSVIICGETAPKHQAFKNELLQKIKANDLEKRIVFLGNRDFDELPNLFRSMSIVVALSRNEGFGLTILEAMASGVPVLASEAGAWKEIVREGVDGYLVACGKVKPTEKKLDLMMRRVQKLPSMGMNARKRIESHYTLEREAESLCSFFKKLQ